MISSAVPVVKANINERNKMGLVRSKKGKLKRLSVDTIELYQAGKKFIYVTDIEKLGALFELKTGLVFKYEIAKGCNYFYHFWLEQPVEKLNN